MTEQELQAYIQAIAPADGAAMTAAEKRQAALAKPPGSLGALETISIRLAGITGQVCPAMNKCRVAVFAADNGVVDEGVSCAPRSVTRQQAVNMTRRVTGMSSMAACFGDEVTVVDVGMAQDPHCDAILDRHIRRTTGNIAREDAMTRQQVLDALSAGTEQAALAGRDGVTALGVGEMHRQHHHLRRRAGGAHRGGHRHGGGPGRRIDGRGLRPEEGGAASGRDPAAY